MGLTTTQGKLQLLIGTVAAATFSFHLFRVVWIQWMIAGHTFPVWWDVFPTADLVQSVPFTWPFAVAGFLLGPSLSTPRAPVGWLIFFAVLGAITYGILTEETFREMQGILSTHGLGVYTHVGMPPLFELLGLLTARLVIEV